MPVEHKVSDHTWVDTQIIASTDHLVPNVNRIDSHGKDTVLKGPKVYPRLANRVGDLYRLKENSIQSREGPYEGKHQVSKERNCKCLMLQTTALKYSRFLSLAS